MKKQTYIRHFAAITLCSAALFTAAAAVAQDDIVIGDPFTVDATFGGPSEPGLRSGSPTQTCRIVISGGNGKPSMVCEGVDANGDRVSCTGDRPPFAGPLLAFSADEAELLANLGEPRARCKKLR